MATFSFEADAATSRNVQFVIGQVRGVLFNWQIAGESHFLTADALPPYDADRIDAVERVLRSFEALDPVRTDQTAEAGDA
jgi:hypothetical protein